MSWFVVLSFDVLCESKAMRYVVLPVLKYVIFLSWCIQVNIHTLDSIALVSFISHSLSMTIKRYLPEGHYKSCYPFHTVLLCYKAITQFGSNVLRQIRSLSNIQYFDHHINKDRKVA